VAVCSLGTLAVAMKNLNDFVANLLPLGYGTSSPMRNLQMRKKPLECGLEDPKRTINKAHFEGRTAQICREIGRTIAASSMFRFVFRVVNEPAGRHPKWSVGQGITDECLAVIAAIWVVCVLERCGGPPRWLRSPVTQRWLRSRKRRHEPASEECPSSDPAQDAPI